jgi:hypothetical protein
MYRRLASVARRGAPGLAVYTKISILKLRDRSVSESGNSRMTVSSDEGSSLLNAGGAAPQRLPARYRDMKYAIAALALALGTISSAAAQTPAQPAPHEAVLTVGGDGTIERAPDLARLTVQIITNDDNPTVSSSQNNDRFNVLKAKLAGVGITGEEVRTYGYDVSFIPHPPKNLPPDQRQPRYGYITTRTVQITIAPIENAGKAIDAATAAGVTNVGGLSYELKDQASAYQAALAAAMADAKRIAQTLSAAGGFALGALTRVSSVQDSGVRPLGGQPMFRVAAAPMASTPTDLGSSGPISVTAHVTVSYEIR